MTDEKEKLLAAAISQIEKDHGKGAIMRLGSRDILVPVSVIPAGASRLTPALGVGGFPRGRVIEIYGPGIRRQDNHDAARDRRSAEARRAGGFY